MIDISQQQRLHLVSSDSVTIGEWAMKILKRSIIKNKNIHTILAVILLAAAMGIYSLNKQAAAPQSSPESVTATSSPKQETTAETPSAVVTPSAAQVGDTALPAANPYPVHENIIATVFWAGEDADSSNNFIHNRTSAWMSDWVGAYGGVDSPENRCGYRPCAFSPNENPFYFALPFSDYDENGLKPDAELQRIPWYAGIIPENTSIIKNRWIEVRHGSRVAYAQWEDVGPFSENDPQYVFGMARPAAARAGLDMSPALADYLAIDGRAIVSWRFIESGDVPKGEWTKLITKSGLHYE
jgi:hypothetical protein